VNDNPIKPVVHIRNARLYSRVTNTSAPGSGGVLFRAVLIGDVVDHPKIGNAQDVRTSRIEYIETQNTRYVIDSVDEED
jgi:hypothetical protein